MDYNDREFTKTEVKNHVMKSKTNAPSFRDKETHKIRIKHCLSLIIFVDCRAFGQLPFLFIETGRFGLSSSFP